MISREVAEIGFDTSTAESKRQTDRPNHRLTAANDDRGHNSDVFIVLPFRKPPEASLYDLPEEFTLNVRGQAR